MVKFRIYFFVLVALLLSIQAAGFVYAQNSESRKVVAPNEVIHGDYVAAGETVEISGLVKGDVYVMGGQVLVNGVIEGDLLALGGVVSISGKVNQNVRVAGWQVILSGVIGRNVTVGAMNIEMTQKTKLAGSLIAGGANIILQGPIEKGIRVAGRNLTVTNIIGGGVDAAVENIRFASGARVLGDFTYWSNRDASISENVVIEGVITKKAAQGVGAYIDRVTRPITKFINPFFGIVSFLSSLLIGSLLVRFFPDYVRQTVLTLRTRKWRSMTNGITALLLLPIVFGILIITIVGIPLGFVLLLISSLIFYIARIFVMFLLGMIIAEKLHKNISDVWAFTIGLIAYTVLAQVPVVGWIVSFGAALFGLGASVQTVKEKYFSGSGQNTV